MVPHERTIGDGLLRVVSMGFLVEDEETALMWRGLMLNRGVQHFLEDVDWGDDLDYLLIDMPPGTGDVQMGVAKLLPRAEVIIVTTPALRRPEGGGPGRRHGPQELPARRRRDREHERVHLRARHDLRAVRRGRRRGAGRRGRRAAARPGPARAGGGRRRRRRRARSRSATGPAAEAFRAIADRIVNEAVPPVEMAGCTARMLDAAVAALDALDARGRRPRASRRR